MLNSVNLHLEESLHVEKLLYLGGLFRRFLACGDWCGNRKILGAIVLLLRGVIFVVVGMLQCLELIEVLLVGYDSWFALCVEGAAVQNGVRAAVVDSGRGGSASLIAIDESEVSSAIEFLGNLDGKALRSLGLLGRFRAILCCDRSIPVLLGGHRILLDHAGFLFVNIDEFHFFLLSLVWILLGRAALRWRIRIIKC